MFCIWRFQLKHGSVLIEQILSWTWGELAEAIWSDNEVRGEWKVPPPLLRGWGAVHQSHCDRTKKGLITYSPAPAEGFSFEWCITGELCLSNKLQGATLYHLRSSDVELFHLWLAFSISGGPLPSGPTWGSTNPTTLVCCFLASQKI